MKKNNKGFSLVELIIVIAIMVALVAVLAPTFVRYVQKSRDAVVTQASESVLDYVKTEYGTTLNGAGVIRVGADDNGFIKVTFKDGELTYSDEAGRTGESGFEIACGCDGKKKCQSDLAYLISITNDGGISTHPQIEVEEVRES